jgi:hypothetical protein
MPARLAAARSSRPLLFALVVTAIITGLRLGGTVDSDVAWQLWVAGRINGGADLYRDIIEVNPPLWFWMAVPIERVAALLHVRPEAVLVTATSIAIMLALAATDQLVDASSPLRRALLQGYAALILMAMPWVHIGQREQIVLIGTVPYAALIAARRAGRPVAPPLAFLIGAGAAFGFALKHYFLLVPAMLELWLFWGEHGSWRWRRPEIISLMLVGAGYGAAILVWTPDFLTSIVPLVRLSYGALGAPTVADLFGPFAIVGLLVLLIAAVQALPLSRGDSRFGSAMLVAAAAFAAIYFIQAKGWIYHSLPMLGCGSLALAAFMIVELSPKRILKLSGPALLVLPLLLTMQEQRRWAPGTDLTRAIDGLHPGDTVGFLAVETAIPWSVTLQHGFRYPSRYMGFWMLNAVVMNEHQSHPDPRLGRLGRQIVSDTVIDFRCTPPKRIIAARPRPGQPGFDILDFFLRDPQFAELLSHYSVRSRTSFETFELRSPWPRVAHSRCTSAA